MSKKRLLFMTSIVLVLSTVLAGCSGKSNDTANGGSPAASMESSDSAASPEASKKASDPDKVVTVRVGVEKKADFNDDMIADFEKSNPNIKIEIIEGVDPWSGYNKLLTMIATGTAPDVFMVSGADQIPGFASKKLLLNIDPYVDKSEVIKKDDLLPIVNVYRYSSETGQGSGELYGFPKDWSPDYTLFYNKKMFDDAGVPYPSSTEHMTWQQVFDLAKKLTIKKDGKVQQAGLQFFGGNLQASQFLMLPQMMQEGASFWSDDFTKVTFDTPETKALLNTWVDLVKSDVGANVVNQMTSTGWQAFLDNKSAMLLSGYWFGGMLRGGDTTKNNLDNYAMAPTPVMDPGKPVLSVCGTATGFSINASTKVPDQAYKVLEYISAGKPADDRAKSGWGLPIFKSKMDLIPKETAFDQQLLSVVNEELKFMDKPLPFNPYINGGAFDSLLDKYLVPVYFGKSTVDDAAKTMQTELQKLVDEGMQIVGKS